jgi:hypothetical protein
MGYVAHLITVATQTLLMLRNVNLLEVIDMSGRTYDKTPTFSDTPMEIPPFWDMLSVSKPLEVDMVEYMKNLTEGVEVNLDKPLNPEDE